MKTKFLILSACINFSLFGQFVRGPLSFGESEEGPLSMNYGVNDGFYISEHIPTKRVIPYAHVREADVLWSKRVWSVIDLREKINQPLYYPTEDIQAGMWNRNTSTWSLWTVIREHVLKGELTVYSPFNPQWEAWTDGDEFKYPIKPSYTGGRYDTDSIFRQELFLYLGTEYKDPFAMPLKSWLDPTEDSVVTLANNTKSLVYPPGDTLWFLSQDIIQYKLKEDWFFDKERSVLERRVIGIAPIVHQKDVNGNITGMRELFWLYFPECRYVFQNYFVASRQNDAQRMSLDDLFWKRMFHSYIIKESNLANRSVEEYAAGVDALLEAEEIKNSIANFEHNLWEY